MNNFSRKKTKNMNKIELITIPKHEVIDENGFKSVVLRDTTQDLLMLSLSFPAGGFEEEIPGLSYLTMQMLTTGTKKYTAKEISETADKKGLRLNSISNRDDSMISAYGLAEHHETAIDLLEQCLLYPKFDEDELARLKQKTVADIELRISEPDYLAQITFIDKFFEGTGYQKPRLGFPETVVQITTEDCRKHFEKIKSAGAILTVAGNFKTGLVEELREKFKPLAVSKKHTSSVEYISPKLESSVIIRDKENAPQASITAGIPAMSRLDEDYPVLQLVNTIFGGYFGSKLNHILREERGYTYGIHSLIDGRRHSGVMKINTDTDNAHVEKMLPVIKEEAMKLAENLLDKEEFETGKNYMLGSFLRSTETTFHIASLLRNIHINEFPQNYFENYLKAINEATREEFRRIAERHFAGASLTVAIAGDKKKLEHVRI
jgi:zinc protease